MKLGSLEDFKLIHIGEHQSIIPDYTYTNTHYTHCIMTLENVFIFNFFTFIQYKVPTLYQAKI